MATRADAARDAGHYLLAANLYEEALRMRPDATRLQIQCGHMFKEAGRYGPAEDHYLTALQSLPDDPDLALQLGHFYKLAARPDEAEASYRRALELRPDWPGAAEELARIRSSHGTSEPNPDSSARHDLIVPELLPQGRIDAPKQPDRLRVTHLAPRRMRTERGVTKVLRGIEAIRGHYVSSVEAQEVLLLLDGVEIRRELLQPYPIVGTAQTKYVFNIWHDFSDVPPGRHLIEVKVVDGRLLARKHREHLEVVPAWQEADWPNSDGVVSVDRDAALTLEEQINARPSTVRSARRTPLPGKIDTILVQRADQLGDLVCSVPAIRRLRDLFPGARLIGLVTSANAELSSRLGLFDEIVVAELVQEASGRRAMVPTAQLSLREKLAAYDIDLAIDLCENSDSRPLLLLSGASFLYGFKPKEFAWLTAGFEMVSRDGSNSLEAMPASRKILALVEALGALRIDLAEPLPLATPDRRRLARYGIDESRPYIVLHTGARLAFSRWSRFGKLAELLLERTSMDIVLMGEALPDQRVSPSDRVHVIDGLMPFDDFDTLLACCAGFVGNDSGTKHLAALRGAPVVSLHMARLNWNEWGQDFGGAIISRRVPCAGCGIHDHPEECGQNFACIRMIQPEEIVHILMQLARG